VRYQKGAVSQTHTHIQKKTDQIIPSRWCYVLEKRKKTMLGGYELGGMMYVREMERERGGERSYIEK